MELIREGQPQISVIMPSLNQAESIGQALEADLDLHFAMDHDLWLRISMHYPIHVVEGHWANYRFHERSKPIASTDRFLPEWKT